MTNLFQSRAARPEEAEAVLETLCAAFDLNMDAARPIFYADPYYDISHKRVLALPGEGIVSCLTVVPTLLRVGGVPVGSGGIAGVATRPEFQRRGHAAALLEAAVPALWDELGYPLSLLHPLSAPFYRRFGWETASRVVSWAAIPAALPCSAETAPIRPVTEADWPAVHRLHAEMTQADTGACVRDSRRWALIQMAVPGRETHVYQDAGKVTGYLIYERRETLELLEMHGRTPEARRGLIGFLAGQPEPVIEWQTSPELLRLFELPLPDAPTEPDVMLRLVNLHAALSAVHAALYAPVLTEREMTLTLWAADSLCRENERPLRLTPEGITSGTANDAPWLHADIGTLARLYLGDWLPTSAHAAGLLTTDSPRTLTLADRLFPLRQPYIAPLDQS